MSNMSHIEKNIFDSLGDCDDAQNSFLTFLNKVDAYKAEKLALEVKHISATQRFIDFAANQYSTTCSQEIKDDLLQFILTRHKNWRLV